MVRYRRRKRGTLTIEQRNKILSIRKKQVQQEQLRKQRLATRERERSQKRVRELYKQYLAWLKLTKRFNPDCECGNGGIVYGW